MTNETLADILGPEAAMKFKRAIESIEMTHDSLEYGERLFQKLIEEGNTEAAERVDRAFEDTRLKSPNEIKISRPSKEFISQWPLVSNDNDVGMGSEDVRKILQNSHMKDIYNRAAYHPELYSKPTHSELFLMLFCIVETEPLNSENYETLKLLIEKIGLSDKICTKHWGMGLGDENEFFIHPEADLYLQNLMKDSEVKGRNKPSGEAQWSKRQARIDNTKRIVDLIMS